MKFQWTKPSRTWATAQVTAVSGWVIAAIQAGWEINASLQITAVTIVAAAITSYGVSEKDSLSRRKKGAK